MVTNHFLPSDKGVTGEVDRRGCATKRGGKGRAHDYANGGHSATIFGRGCSKSLRCLTRRGFGLWTHVNSKGEQATLFRGSSAARLPSGRGSVCQGRASLSRF